MTETADMLVRAAREAGMFVSGDLRVSETDLAALLGYTPGHLRNLRSEGRGPVAYRVGLNGSRLSYRLLDVGAWIDRQRE